MLLTAELFVKDLADLDYNSTVSTLMNVHRV